MLSLQHYERTLEKQLELDDFKLDPKIKEEWIAALRSGEFEQGTEKLSDGKKYCCLGVYCKINQYDYDDINLDGIVNFYSNTGSDCSCFFVPGGAIPSEIQTILSAANDDGHSFETIADLIEEYL